MDVLNTIQSVLQSIDLDTVLDITKVAVGLIYLYLEYHARRSLWIASVIMPCIGMWLFYNKGLYADFAINIYYLVIAVYGWIVWSRSSKDASNAFVKTEAKSEVAISHVPLKMILPIVALWLCVWGLIAWILATFTDSTVVVLDSMTTSMSIVAMWMLARKYIEQWFVWFVVDAIYVYLYWYKGIYFSGSLYAFYTGMAIVGYRKWCRLKKEADAKA
ncbi:MAG: nicotinamide mononucleotide transporter [Muribaculaceae bacterium]|nr:nicotinamide mononucleotide transporter [Muribaculaceae bacterium]